ncbi:kinase isozyme 4 [Xylaria sp. CBS 124048]|nr:kinase isozyme 4 [Xylaria sp. CBS 124048]
MGGILRPLRRLYAPNCLFALTNRRLPARLAPTFISTRASYSAYSSFDDSPRLTDTSTITVNSIAELGRKPQHTLSLADLIKHGRPPLSKSALLASANFTLSLLPIRLARRIEALRNLPFIVVANPNISRIYNNYLHSLSTLIPWQHRTISNLEDEIKFTKVLAELVATHQDTIPVLAKGFIQSRKYIDHEDVTKFLDTHLRTRIGTRLIAEQHIALHYSSVPHFDPKASPTPCPENPNYIGVINTTLCPATTVHSCAEYVADICELQYGVRPKWIIDGEPEATFTFIPMHLEYIVTELLKNAFRATIENRDYYRKMEPVVITIAPELAGPGPGPIIVDPPAEDKGAFRADRMYPLDDNAPGFTIRIRDRGGGISPSVLPNIWNYSFTTFNDDDVDEVLSNHNNNYNSTPSNHNGSGSGSGSSAGGRSQKDALGVISAASSGASSIAGLGYGLPLSRAYAEYFGGGIAVQSLYGWGTDVYLRLKGVGTNLK